MIRLKTDKDPAPEIGMGATWCFINDRYGCTIVDVQRTKKGTPKSVTVQRDRATRVDNNGMSERQDYSYEPNTSAERIVFTLRKNGRFVRNGSDSHSGVYLKIGNRISYHDFSS